MTVQSSLLGNMFADTGGDQAWMMNHCLVEASEWIEVGLLRTLLCFLVARSAYSFESLAWCHGWDCRVQGVCVHDRWSRAGRLHDRHGSVIFRYLSPIHYVPHSYGVVSGSHLFKVAGTTQKSIGPPIGHYRQFLAI